MPIKPHRIFLLSPANCSGKRAEILLREQASFDLARRLRTPAGITLGRAFTFLSGLYFRGKLAYASHFAHVPRGIPKILIITAGCGLLPPEATMTAEDLRDTFGAEVHGAAEILRLRSWPFGRSILRVLFIYLL